MSSYFPNVYDTKYLAEFVARDEATFLQYLFRLAVYRKTISFECVSLPLEYQIIKGAKESVKEGHIDSICEQYATHGNCRHGVGCEYSHDVDYIIDVRESKKKGVPCTRKAKPNAQADIQVPQVSHSAGFDAFATSVVFASFLARFGKQEISAGANHFYLMFHNRPFLFQASKY